jgi:hypothetical protein
MDTILAAVLFFLTASAAPADTLHVASATFSFLNDGVTQVSFAFDWDTATDAITDVQVSAFGPQATAPFTYIPDSLLTSPDGGAITVMDFASSVNGIQLAAGTYFAPAFSIYPTPGTYPIALNTWCSGLDGSGCPFAEATFLTSQVTVTAVGVPEPVTWILLLVGSVLIFAVPRLPPIVRSVPSPAH